MSHYFTNDENLKENPRIISHEFGGKIFKFHTNSGVFSPEKIDFATNLLIENIAADFCDDAKSAKRQILDLACGYGPIGIILGKIFEHDITMSDVNRRALELAKINCETNGVDVKIIESDVFSRIVGKFDTITLNPPIHAGKEVCRRMYYGAAEHLAPDGALYIVIQKKHGANSTMATLNEIFGEVKILYKKKGYYILRCEN